MYRPPPLHSRAPIPPTVRWQVMLRALWRCEDGCGSTRLELHHVRYHRNGRPIFGVEHPDDLAALCRDCHHARHIAPDGQFWSDPEEMHAYWSKAS